MRVFDLLLTALLVTQFAFGWLPIATAATTQATKVNRVLGDDLTAFINSDRQITLTDKSHKTGQFKEILRGIVLDMRVHKSGAVLTKCFLTGGEQLNVLSRGKREAKTIIKLEDGTATIGKVIACTDKTLTLLSDSGVRRELLWNAVARVISPYFCTISGVAGKSSLSTFQYAVKAIVTADGAFYKAPDIQLSYCQPTTTLPWLDLKNFPKGVFGAVFDMAPDSDKAFDPPKTTFDPRSLTTFDCSSSAAFTQQAYVFRMQMAVPQQLAYAGCEVAHGEDANETKTTDLKTDLPGIHLMWSTMVQDNVANPGAGDKRKPDDGGKSDTGNKPDAGRNPDSPPDVSCDSEAVRFQVTSPLLLTTVPIDPVPPPPNIPPEAPPVPPWDRWPPPPPERRHEMIEPSPKPPLQDSALPDPKGGVQPPADNKIALATPNVTSVQTTLMEEAQNAGKCAVTLSSDSDPLTCNMTVENLTNAALTLKLPEFSCFLAPDVTANQNMMKGSDPTFVVPAGQSIAMSIDTFCVSTKSIKTPPKDGLKYRLGPYPDKEVHKKLVYLIETANRLNKEGVYDAVPLKAEMRPRKVAQTAIWMYLGKRSGKNSEYITVDSLKDDLLNSGQVPAQFTPEQLKRVELFAQLIFTAADKTVKEATTGK